MFRPKTMLKVVSIFFIIGGVLGLFGTVVLYAMIPKMSEIPGVDMSVLEAAMTPFGLITSVFSSISSVCAGVFGFTGKSAKYAKIFAGIYTALLVVSTIQSAIGGTFTFLVVVDFIIPVLYWWGLYQSE